MSEEEKWDCIRCTYKNFPVSRKCVLCQGQRPMQVISDRENSEQDIYKVAELEARQKENTGSQSNKSSEMSSSEWSCCHCTFLNCAGSKKCLQCRLPIDQKVMSPMPERTKPLSITFPAVTSGETSSSGIIRLLSPNTRALEIDKGSSITVSAGLLKWSCTACTYENFPKAKLCVMCHTKRDSSGESKEETSPTNPLILNQLQLQIDVDSKNQENTKSGQNSPNRAIASHQRNNKSGQSSPQNMHQQAAANSNRVSPGSSNNKSGQSSPKNASGHNSPNNRSSPPCSRKNINQGNVIPCNSDSGLNSPKQTSPKNNRSGAVGAIGGQKEEDRRERRIQKLRRKLNREDSIWLNACESVVKGDSSGIEIYLTSGGDPARQLTKDEELILDRAGVYEIGHTLVHLALRFRRDDMVAVLLAATDISSKGFKRLPSYMCPDLSSALRREISVMLRQRKGSFSCYFLADTCTFTLPAAIEDLPRHVQTHLFEEILDTDVDKELTEEGVINWSLELTENLRSRLYALWNRTAGDCLLDSVLQATWGILDIDNTLRRALSDSLLEASNSFYPKWKDYETVQAHLLNFSLDEDQWQRDWALLLNFASQPGASLEHLHIFALAHILRRPIIVYGVKVVKSFRGESIDFARFEGVYLPLLWERSFCSTTPIALGYTRGHFSALVPMEIDTGIPLEAGAHTDNAVDEQVFYLPLVDNEGSFLPIHFVTGTELGQEETILRKWFDCIVTQEGLFVSVQKIEKRPAVVGQMLEMWLDHYRQEALGGPRDRITSQYSSDDDSD